MEKKKTRTSRNSSRFFKTIGDSTSLGMSVTTQSSSGRQYVTGSCTCAGRQITGF